VENRNDCEPPSALNPVATLLPASLWKAGHIAVAVLCVWKGIQLLTT
jgi:hypothetical protein